MKAGKGGCQSQSRQKGQKVKQAKRSGPSQRRNAFSPRKNSGVGLKILALTKFVIKSDMVADCWKQPLLSRSFLKMHHTSKPKEK